ncbi:MAG: RdgB/HAM1 family non-canonical purine NTP pyrophosphatase [Pseudomonadales bacterium]|nr:RdgB/HAM1 family non-canonical purine NTP pyrophosphatase [Pseudomonadales bacterium]
MYERLILASSNTGKLREFRAMLGKRVGELVTQDAAGMVGADETGLSFVENALLKARHASQQSGLAALADDSGLVVEVLKGAPGIYSARYAGPHATDSDNNAKLLRELDRFTSPRLAYYVAAIVLVRYPQDPMPLIAQAQWHGEILHVAQGQGGFGYDPLFYVPEEGMTAAEMSPDRKNRLSHRAKALAELLAAWPLA